MGALRTISADEAGSAVGVRVREAIGNPVRLLGLVVFLLVVVFALPAWLDSYWMQVITSVVIYSVVTLGLGLLIGRVGMVSLCQFVLLALGRVGGPAAQLRHRPALPRAGAAGRAHHRRRSAPSSACPRCACPASTSPSSP